MKCLKILMFLFNLIFVICGLTILIVGIVVQVQFNSYVAVLGSDLSKAPYVCIAVGLIIFLIAFFGCCGAYKENHCMMMTFATMLTLILILEVVATALAVAYKDDVENVVRDGLKKALPSYNKDSHYRKVFDDIQKDMKCCGVQNYTDWKTENVTSEIPESCCIDVNNCNRSFQVHQGIYPKGCVDALNSWASSHLVTVAGVAGAFCLIELLGILFACCLGRAFNAQYEVV